MLKRILTVTGILMLFSSFGFAADTFSTTLKDQQSLNGFLHGIIDHPWFKPAYTISLVGAGTFLIIKHNGFISFGNDAKLDVKKLLSGMVLVLLGFSWNWAHKMLGNIIDTATGDSSSN